MRNRDELGLSRISIPVLLISLMGVTLPALLTKSYITLLVSMSVPILYVVHTVKSEANWPVYAQTISWFVGGSLFWYPMYNDVLYAVLMTNPGGIQWFIIGLLLAIASLLFSFAEDVPVLTDSLWQAFSVGFLVFAFFGLLIMGPVVDGVYTKSHFADEGQANAVEVDALPDSSEDKSRIAPQSVARNWAENSLQYPQYALSGGDITYINGTPHWSYSLSPDGFVNTFTNNQIGGVFVNQSTTTKDIVTRDDFSFEYGQGMELTDNVNWKLAETDYLKDYKEPFVVPHGTDATLAVPYQTVDWEFRLTPIPQFYSVPKFSGVKIVSENGDIEDVSPDEAQSNDVLEGQNYYPYGLARYRVESQAYKNGILNVLFRHEDQIEVAGVPGQGNSQPFTVPTEDGIKYFVAAEPWGDANGIYEIWMIDAQTGEMEVRELSADSSYRGPRKAIDSIMATPQISRLNNVRGIEPIPVVRDGTLYWQVRIVPDSASRITYVAFFNAGTEEVTVVETTEQVKTFLAAEQVAGVPGESSPGGNESQSQTCDFVVVVDRSDGETERLCLQDGDSVDIRAGNESSSQNQSE